MSILKLQELRPVAQESLVPVVSHTSSWVNCCVDPPDDDD
ncbi:class III lanthipeptide [Streptomyces sp. NRRL F-5123]|nr:class III lanthipeptide [Streptomyces sp. NRRL F-5123]